METESKDKQGFVIYKDFYPPIEDLTDEEMGKLFRAIFLYQREGLTEVDPNIKMAFRFFLNQFNIDHKKYLSMCQKNSDNAKKRWNGQDATGCDGMRPHAMDADKDKDKDKDIGDRIKDKGKKEKDIDTDKERLSFLNIFYEEQIKTIDKAIENEKDADYPDTNDLKRTKRNYSGFIDFLRGNNKLNRELTKCMSLEPLTVEQFKELKRIEMQSGGSLFEKCEFFEDGEYKAKHKTLYTHLKSWLKPQSSSKATNDPYNGAFGGPVSQTKQ